MIISFRATGENHISSVVFKRGILKKNGVIHFEPSGKFITEGAITQQERESKAAFRKVLAQLILPVDVFLNIMDQLNDTFSYKELETALKNSLPAIGSTVEEMKLKHEILSAVNTNYEIQFPADSLLSERVIFPVTRAEKNGMEDARFRAHIESRDRAHEVTQSDPRLRRPTHRAGHVQARHHPLPEALRRPRTTPAHQGSRQK